MSAAMLAVTATAFVGGFITSDVDRHFGFWPGAACSGIAGATVYWLAYWQGLA